MRDCLPLSSDACCRTMTSRKAIARWFEYRSPVWQRVAAELRTVERGKSASPDAVLELVRSYPELARDLAIARREAPTGNLTRHLEQIYLALHRVVFRPPASLRRDLVRLFVGGAAEAAAALRWQIGWVTLLFVACIAAGWWLIASFPDLVPLVASDVMIEKVMNGELWTDGMLNVMPSSLVSLQIFTNNIVVSLFALSLGVFYGLGTIYIVGLNGIMVGGVFAFTAQYGMSGRLFEFVSAHGFVELSVVCLAGAVGASLGEALARPGHLTRAAAFHAASARGMRLMAVALIFLVGAGLLEGYVSPSPSFPPALKLVVGLGYWVVFLFVLGGGLKRLRARRAATA